MYSTHRPCAVFEVGRVTGILKYKAQLQLKASRYDIYAFGLRLYYGRGHRSQEWRSCAL